VHAAQLAGGAVMPDRPSMVCMVQSAPHEGGMSTAL
jgi:hypothetical protein